jgi:anti-sigma regulatory factor (Ser/Thr protein kinase)
LIYVINDLLDLTKAEEGQDLIQDAIFDLPATLHEATDSFRGEAKRKGLEYEVIEHPGVPKLVHGDQRRVRQAVANITANAIQHTNSGWVRVEIWLQEILEDRVTIEIVVQDTGAGMSNEKLDALFRDLEQVTTDGDEFLDDSEEASRKITQGGKDNRTLGLGLAMVARIVRNMDGQLRLKSEEGKGSRFVIQLSFILPEDESGSRASSVKLSLEAPVIATPPPPAATEGEITLIDKASSLRSEGVVRRRSIEEIASLYSNKSGSSNRSGKSAKSDVDRLIDAISTPLAVGEPETEERSLQRSTSRGSGHSRKSAGSIGTPSTRTSMSNTGPGNLRRSKSYGAPEHLRTPIDGPAGSEFVTDNKTLLKAVRIPEDFVASPTEETPPHTASRVLFDIPDSNDTAKPEIYKKLDAEHLQILVAEDDPVNSRIIQKRLEKSGHEVHHTVNGEDCASAYGDKPAFFDVVLMDMQVSFSPMSQFVLSILDFSHFFIFIPPESFSHMLTFSDAHC